MPSSIAKEFRLPMFEPSFGHLKEDDSSLTRTSKEGLSKNLGLRYLIENVLLLLHDELTRLLLIRLEV